MGSGRLAGVDRWMADGTARSYASSAEIAGLMKDEKATQARLRASADLLASFSEPPEEFNQVSWFQMAGACALILGHSEQALQEFQRALHELPTERSLHYAITLIPCTIAYARV